MKILFASDNFYLPQLSGGTEVSIDCMASVLLRKGHKIAVSCALSKSGVFFVKNRLSNKLFSSSGTYNGYPVYRDWDSLISLKTACDHFKPDLVFLMKNSQQLLNKLYQLEIPTVVYLGDIFFRELNLTGLSLDNIKFIANSRFTKMRFQESFNSECAVAPPLIESIKYKTTKGHKILFVNPHEMKGIDIVSKLVELNPNLEFLIVESWPIPKQQLYKIKNYLNKFNNVEWLPCQKNMKKIYSKTKLVLMPSQCDEAWGRVASEAQVSSIPVIASNRGGLPESVGPGGILISKYNDINHWQKTLAKVTDDNDIYDQLSKKSLDHSLRKEMDPGYIINIFLSAGVSAIKGENMEFIE